MVGTIWVFGFMPIRRYIRGSTCIVEKASKEEAAKWEAILRKEGLSMSAGLHPRKLKYMDPKFLEGAYEGSRRTDGIAPRTNDEVGTEGIQDGP